MDAKFAEEIAPLLLRGILRMSSPSASIGSMHALRWRECKLVLKPKELEQAACGTEPILAIEEIKDVVSRSRIETPSQRLPYLAPVARELGSVQKHARTE